MQSWPDWGASYADRLTLETSKIHPRKSITLGDTVENDHLHHQSRCAPGTTDLIPVPVFTGLAIKDLLSFGDFQKKICLKRRINY
jgi:hypothetical protein